MSLRNRVGNDGFDNLFDESEVRTDFNEESIKELSYNIEENGQLQPIIVFGVDATGKHKIHQGERRWRAVILSNKLTHIDCIVRNSESIFSNFLRTYNERI